MWQHPSDDADGALVGLAEVAAAAVLVSTAVQYTVDVENATAIPDDAYIHHGPIDWGISAAGVHYTDGDGSWMLHGLWACNCQGTCGLECNQPAPNLLPGAGP